MTGPNSNNIQKAKISKSPRVSTTTKKRIHDDFSDLMDYIMLDSIEREKHRIDVERIHPVVEKNVEGTIRDDNNPTIADIKKIKIS